MEPDPYADLFRFRRGACVRWVDYPHTQHYVCERRMTERAFDLLIEYRLSLSHDGDAGRMGWVRYEDLQPWEE